MIGCHLQTEVYEMDNDIGEYRIFQNITHWSNGQSIFLSKNAENFIRGFNNGFI